MKHLFIFLAAISFSCSAAATSLKRPSEFDYLHVQVENCLKDMPDYLICEAGENHINADLLSLKLAQVNPTTEGLVLEHWGDRFELVGINFRYMLEDKSSASIFFWCPGETKDVKLITRSAAGVSSETAAVCSGVDSPLEE